MNTCQITIADELASRRGSRVFSNNDLIFQFRHDAARVERIQKFLALKALRKLSKDDEEDIEKAEAQGADAMQRGSADSLEMSQAVVAATRLPWDANALYTELPPGPADLIVSGEQDATNLAKLRAADAKTLNMTVAEYATWSECRHASFTKRRVVRFRQWCGLGVVGDHKVTDDVLDILGFLTGEMVQRLTGLALAFQEREICRRASLHGEQKIERKGLESLLRPESGQQRRSPVDWRHIQQAYDVTQIERAAGGVRRRGMWTKEGLCLI